MSVVIIDQQTKTELMSLFEFRIESETCIMYHLVISALNTKLGNFYIHNKTKTHTLNSE